MVDGDNLDLGPNKEGPSLQDGHALCPLDEEKPVGFTSTAIPAVGTEALKCSPPPLEIEVPCSTDQLSSRQDQNADAIDTPFDAHAAGWEVVDGKAYEPELSTLNHSDWTEDRGTTYKRSNRRRQGHLHEAKEKQPTPIPAPHIHPDCFEDPISDQFWEDIWVASAEHNVSAYSVSLCILTEWLSQTEIYRKVFHAIPDDTVTTWKQYKHFVAYHERFTKNVSFWLYITHRVSYSVQGQY